MEKEEIEAQIKHEVDKINGGFARIEKIRAAAKQLGEIFADFDEDGVNAVLRETFEVRRSLPIDHIHAQMTAHLEDQRRRAAEHERKVPRRNCVPVESTGICKDIGVDKMQLDAYLQPDNDPVNHPSHYTVGIETIEFIESWDMPYHLGNVVKYLCRAPHKGRQMEDLQKALWYLRRYVKFLTKKQEAVNSQGVKQE